MFFYPKDFTFVCPTEILQFSNTAAEFKKAGCEVVGVSCDSVESHMMYCNMERKKGGLGSMEIPLIGDFNKNMARDFNCLLDDGATLRGTYIIDDKGILRHMQVNDRPVGRNVEETLRLVQAFKFTDEHGEVCPATWKKKGDKTMVPEQNDKKTLDYFSEVHDK